MVTNKLLDTIVSTNDSKDLVGEFPAFQVGNEAIIYAIPYNYLRSMAYFPIDKTLAFTGEGNQFIIRGKNMRHLFEMLTGRMISRIIEGDSLKIGGEDVEITSVIISSLAEDLKTESEE